MNGNDVSKSLLSKLKRLLVAYQVRMKNYFDTHILATCLVYISAENIIKIEDFFDQLDKYFSYSIYSLIAINSCYMLPIDFIGFPNDCSYKLTAKISNGQINITQSGNPIFEIEKKKNKPLGNIERARDDQNNIEQKIYQQKKELWKAGEEHALKRFKLFAEKNRYENTELLKNFERCITLCNMLIEKQNTNATNSWLPEIEKIFSVLKNGYINVSFEEFSAIFQPDYSRGKIEWLRDGAELKFFIDKIIGECFNVNSINKWAGSRFKLNGKDNLTSYLGTVRHKNSYYNRLEYGFDRQNQIYKLSKEF